MIETRWTTCALQQQQLAVALINASFFEGKKKLGGSNRYKYANTAELWLVFVVVIRGNTMTLSCFTEIYYIFLNFGLFACSRGPLTKVHTINR